MSRSSQISGDGCRIDSNLNCLRTILRTDSGRNAEARRGIDAHGERRTLLFRVLFALLLASLAVPAAAQDLRSGEVVKQLTQLLDSKKLDTIAVADAKNPGTFIAAMYIPGTQLLVVSAKYAAPAMLTELVARKDFKGVYIELSSASVPSSKLLVMDAYANGLLHKPTGDQPADSIERGGTVSTFDGGWKKAKIAEADYMKTFGEADAAYIQLLQLLLTQLKSTGTS